MSHRFSKLNNEIYNEIMLNELCIAQWIKIILFPMVAWIRQFSLWRMVDLSLRNHRLNKILYFFSAWCHQLYHKSKQFPCSCFDNWKMKFLIEIWTALHLRAGFLSNFLLHVSPNFDITVHSRCGVS